WISATVPVHAIATTTAHVIATTTARVIGTGSGMGSAGSVDTTRPRVGSRPLTDVRTDGPCKTVFANHIEATEDTHPMSRMRCSAKRLRSGAPLIRDRPSLGSQRF